MDQRRREPGPRRRRVDEVASAVLALVLLVAGFALLGSSHAGAAGVSGGAAVAIDTTTGDPVTGGGSATPFELSLPLQAACSGDTQDDGYHVFSYVSAADPSTLDFNANGPSDGFTLYRQAHGAAYRGEATALGGAIQAIPAFDFANFGATDQGGDLFALPPGAYNVGIACADTLGAGDRFWNLTVTFDASGTDPNGETWTVTSGTTTTTTATTSTSTSTSEPSTTTTTGGSTTTTTTTGGSTTTTTSVGTTTTTTTIGPTTTSPGSSVRGESASGPSGSVLARTGDDTGRPALIGALLVYLGVVVLLFGRRWRMARDLAW